MAVHRFESFTVIGTAIDSGETIHMSTANDREIAEQMAAASKQMMLDLLSIAGISDAQQDLIITCARSIRVLPSILVVNEPSHG